MTEGGCPDWVMEKELVPVAHEPKSQDIPLTERGGPQVREVLVVLVSLGSLPLPVLVPAQDRLCYTCLVESRTGGTCPVESPRLVGGVWFPCPRLETDVLYPFLLSSLCLPPTLSDSTWSPIPPQSTSSVSFLQSPGTSSVVCTGPHESSDPGRTDVGFQVCDLQGRNSTSPSCSGDCVLGLTPRVRDFCLDPTHRDSPRGTESRTPEGLSEDLSRFPRTRELTVSEPSEGRRQGWDVPAGRGEG